MTTPEEIKLSLKDEKLDEGKLDAAIAEFLQKYPNLGKELLSRMILAKLKPIDVGGTAEIFNGWICQIKDYFSKNNGYVGWFVDIINDTGKINTLALNASSPQFNKLEIGMNVEASGLDWSFDKSTMTPSTLKVIKEKSLNRDEFIRLLLSKARSVRSIGEGDRGVIAGLVRPEFRLRPDWSKWSGTGRPTDNLPLFSIRIEGQDDSRNGFCFETKIEDIIYQEDVVTIEVDSQVFGRQIFPAPMEAYIDIYKQYSDPEDQLRAIGTMFAGLKGMYVIAVVRGRQIQEVVEQDTGVTKYFRNAQSITILGLSDEDAKAYIASYKTSGKQEPEQAKPQTGTEQTQTGNTTPSSNADLMNQILHKATKEQEAVSNSLASCFGKFDSENDACLKCKNNDACKIVDNMVKNKEIEEKQITDVKVYLNKVYEFMDASGDSDVDFEVIMKKCSIPEEIANIIESVFTIQQEAAEATAEAAKETPKGG